jgi:hypothetical protein
LTKELCLQLNIANYNPTFVSWEALDSRVRGGVEFRYDECVIEKYCVTLSAKMKDVLEPDDWKPIIASSLIFSKKLRIRGLRQTGVIFAGLVAIAVLLSFLLPVLLPQPFTTTTRSGSSYTGTLGAAIFPLLALALVIPGTVIISVVIARRLKTLADRDATDIVSATAFVTTLETIARTMRETGYQERRFVRGRIPLLPDIQTRIVRMKGYEQAFNESK